mmetsp:Transcript_12692/g.25774  ORF Transcript_12692/g.25774 Transcript_12692/m.25774 type:complete len:85 (-) Transcript_12692:597-851(-)
MLSATSAESENIPGNVKSEKQSLPGDPPFPWTGRSGGLVSHRKYPQPPEKNYCSHVVVVILALCLPLPMHTPSNGNRMGLKVAP